LKEKETRLRNFQEHDFRILHNERTAFDWACKQTYVALGNMMTAAAMIGIDSCPMEGFEIDKMETLSSSDFGIDTDKFGASHMLAFGCRKNDQPVKTRQTLDEIAKWYN